MSEPTTVISAAIVSHVIYDNHPLNIFGNSALSNVADKPPTKFKNSIFKLTLSRDNIIPQTHLPPHSKPFQNLSSFSTILNKGSKSKMQLYTDRLIIHPLTSDELKLWIDSPNELLKKSNCKYDGEDVDKDFLNMLTAQSNKIYADPENYIFHTFWWIIRKSNNTVIGSFDFKSPPKNGKVEIGYGLGENHRKKGYMTETLNAVCEFALFDDRISEIIAETEKNNLSSQNVLKRCKFTLIKESDTLWWSRNLAVEKFWNEFLKDTSRDMSLPCPESFSFGGDKKMSNELLNLVIKGKKTATSSALPAYKAENQPIPKVGDLSILTDYDGVPYCVLENTDVSLIEFDKMTFDICKLEGEDTCLESWKDKHIEFFKAEATECGYVFSEKMTVVFEKFRVLWHENND